MASKLNQTNKMGCSAVTRNAAVILPDLMKWLSQMVQVDLLMEEGEKYLLSKLISEFGQNVCVHRINLLLSKSNNCAI
jgi:hypothetical protein